MRDPKRIEPVLQAVRTYWYEHPDLRLGQILCILAKGDPFYMEDDAVIEQLKNLSQEK